MRPRIAAAATALLFALPLALPALAQLKTEVVTVEVRPGVTMKYLGLAGSEPPKAAVILLAGGNNVLKLGPTGSIGTDLNLNFLIRSREEFARRGLYVAALDVASDRQRGMDGAIRLSQQYAQDIAKVIAEIKQRTGAPVWLVANSSSTLSTAGAAARLASSSSQPHGIVLTSVQSTFVANYCGKTVYDAELAAIRGPVFVVSHRDDGCVCSPGSAAVGARLITALKGASPKEHKIFTGGSPPLSGPCDARAPHGFFGIESAVVEAIADWIKSH
jgi:pimeloyl-ACP methyl ester carboxylesterase